MKRQPRGGCTPVSAALAARWRPVRAAAVLYGLVAAGTVIGAVARVLLGLATRAVLDPAFPWDTALVNTLGSFLIGFYATLTEPDGRVFASPRQRLFVMGGFCGGFTTFSIFSLDTLLLARTGELTLAALNVGGSVAAWLLSVWAGYLLGSKLNRLGGA